jgi:hypothetical protein
MIVIIMVVSPLSWYFLLLGPNIILRTLSQTPSVCDRSNSDNNNNNNNNNNYSKNGKVEDKVVLN